MGGFFATENLEVNRVELARRQAASQQGYIDLTISNPTQQGFLFPAAILDEAAKAYWGTRRYRPDSHGNPLARAAIATYYRTRRSGFVPEPDRLFLTASTSESYSLLFALLADPGDNILAPDVTYPLFEYLAAMYHVELRPYHLAAEPDWHIDGESLLAAADDRTRAVLIISPHNPTGMVVAQPIPELRQLKCPIICDEVFADFTCRVQQVPPLAALHPDLPVFILNGISKMLALPDLKLGWIALNQPALEEYAARLALLNDTFLGCNSLIQAMLPTLLQQGQPFADAMYAQIRTNIELGLQQLATAPLLRLKPPQGGYYLFPEVDLSGEASDEEDLVVSLLNYGVFVYPGYFYEHEDSPMATPHLMISCLSQPEMWSKGVNALKTGMQQLFLNSD